MKKKEQTQQPEIKFVVYNQRTFAQNWYPRAVQSIQIGNNSCRTIWYAVKVSVNSSATFDE